MLPAASQMRLQQAKRRAQLTIFKSPVKTLYYFACSAVSAGIYAVKFTLSHPFTLFILGPALAAYAASKHLGYENELLSQGEVGAGKAAAILTATHLPWYTHPSQASACAPAPCSAGSSSCAA